MKDDSMFDFVLCLWFVIAGGLQLIVGLIASFNNLMSGLADDTLYGLIIVITSGFWFWMARVLQLLKKG